jgi:hypothetical protein
MRRSRSQIRPVKSQQKFRIRAAGWGGLRNHAVGDSKTSTPRPCRKAGSGRGGGRRHLSSRDATLIEDLRSIIEPATVELAAHHALDDLCALGPRRECRA